MTATSVPLTEVIHNDPHRDNPCFCKQPGCPDSGMQGLRANVYRNADGSDFTLGGLSSRTARVTIIGIREGDRRTEIKPLPTGSRVFKPGDDAPAVVLVYRDIMGRKVVHAEPVDAPPAGSVGYMDGGNYIDSSDSRFRELTGFYGAVSVHDRCETSAQYAALTAGD